MATDAEIAEAHRSAEMWVDVEFQTGPLDSFVSFMHALDWLNLGKAEKGLVRLWLDGRFGSTCRDGPGSVHDGVGMRARDGAGWRAKVRGPQLLHVCRDALGCGTGVVRVRDR